MKLEMSQFELSAVQTILRLANDIDASEIEDEELETLVTRLQTPESKVTIEDWAEQHEDAQADDPELFQADIGATNFHWRLREMCLACGETDCEKDINYVGPNPIHREDHPEMKAMRTRNRRGGW